MTTVITHSLFSHVCPNCQQQTLELQSKRWGIYACEFCGHCFSDDYDGHQILEVGLTPEAIAKKLEEHEKTERLEKSLRLESLRAARYVCDGEGCGKTFSFSEMVWANPCPNYTDINCPCCWCNLHRLDPLLRSRGENASPRRLYCGECAQNKLHFICRCCERKFPSKNILMKHLHLIWKKQDSETRK